MYGYVYVRMFIFLCMCARLHVCMSVWVYECMSVWVYECMGVWVYSVLTVCAFMFNVCVYACVCVHILLRMHGHVYPYATAMKCVCERHALIASCPLLCSLCPQGFAPFVTTNLRCRRPPYRRLGRPRGSGLRQHNATKTDLGWTAWWGI